MLAQAKRREPEALAYLYFIYRDDISRYVYHHVPIDAVDDVVQDVFLKMVRDIHTVHAEDKTDFKAWLNTIVWITIAAYYRKLHYRPYHGADTETVKIVPLEEAYDVIAPDDPTQPLLEAERVATIRSTIEMLTTKQRAIVNGRMGGQGYKAIAQQTGIKEPTARKKHHRALRWMKDELSVLILIAIIVCGAMIATFLYSTSRARPGDSLYPIKQMFTGSPDSEPTPHYRPIAIPTIAPTPTAQPSPTPLPSPTATSRSPMPTHTTGAKNGILGVVATALPVTSDSGTPVTCVLDACVSLP
jgi:RNA polymerase sigma factor (sigma-70 family)